MSEAAPWRSGSAEERWSGYLQPPDCTVLRNRLGETDADYLRDAENDLLEARLLELRENPDLVDRTYDAAHLGAIHRHLFQDVYAWAGEFRTVGLAKGDGESFSPPDSIALPLNHAINRLQESERFQTISPENLADEIAYVYDYINFAHPFREGNGRAQREFFRQALEGSGWILDWSRTESATLHAACNAARNDDDGAALAGLFRDILVPE